MEECPQDSLPVRRFCFTCSLESPVNPDAFFGATLRGGLGYIIKKILCVKHRADCDRCVLTLKCIYRKLFEPVHRGELPPVLRGIRDIPRPFVLDCSEPVDAERPGRLNFTVVLLGNAITYYEYIIYAMIELGKNGITHARIPFRVETVEVDGPSGKRVVYDDHERLIHDIGPEDRGDTPRGAMEEMRLRFLTPVRLKQNGRYRWDGCFESLFKTMLRRITLLEHYYGEPVDRNVRELIEDARGVETIENGLSWHDQSRYSTRQKRRTLHGGYRGSIAYRGRMEKLYPYLCIGESIQVGHNCTFGLGKYRIESIDTHAKRVVEKRKAVASCT